MSTFFRKIFILMVIIPVSDEVLIAQRAIAAAGGSATGNTGSMSYTIGQIDYNTNVALSGTTTEGVQQPFEIFVVTGISETIDILFDMGVFPNPSATFLKLTDETTRSERMIFQLFDMNGRLVRNGNVMGRETYIQIQDLAPGEYLLKVLTSDSVLKTFKIIKKSNL